ncbi:MAG: hypothetical protein IKN87_02245 [Bacilli bacterium]|nr:hypothetical protein [Bacilli bacterium]
MENNDKIVEENVQLVEESVDAADTNSEATSEVVSDTINQEEVVTPIVTDKPVKRRKKDIIGYNPETGEPIYKEIVPGSEPPKKSKKGLVITLISLLLIAGIVVGVILLLNGNGDKKETKDNKEKEKPTEQKPDKPEKPEVLSEYKLLASDVSEYDLFFLKTENKEKNMIYSPLSIKYALIMLNEGTDGDSHDQIKSVVGDYAPKKYANSSNMSFANALFINNKYKDDIKKDYQNTLKSKYNAELIYDDFSGPSTINSWVKEKTLDLIENLLDGLDKNEVFVLVNALGIDMEWNKYFHDKTKDWYIRYPHLKFYPKPVYSIAGGYPSTQFNDVKDKSFFAVDFVGVVDNYDVIADIGEDNIRKTVGEKYKKWLEDGACGSPESEPSVEEYLDKYINEIKTGVNETKMSTDFKIYNDDSVKAFSKELKEYNGTTLEYIAIMPNKEKLSDYVKNVKAEDINKIIEGLKEINNDNFAKDKITYIYGSLPIFEYEYELDLINDLNKLGITDIFDDTKADLSKISKMKGLFIDTAVHKATISFSNEGIKAAAATALGGKGAAGCEFDYFYEPPIEEIDMTFDKPFIYMIVDKDTKEVWFMGTVYEPKEYEYHYNY